MIVQTNIDDREAYSKLLDRLIPILNAYKAKILAADNDAKFLEGEHSFGRTVIVEFESEEVLLAWNDRITELGLADMARNASNTYIVSYVEGIKPV